MAENYKHLYEQMKNMVAMYQDELIPGYRKKMEELESKSKWISVTERLPDQYHKVFMAGRNGGVFIGERTSGTTAVADGHCRGFTHWMELPKAPKED